MDKWQILPNLSISAGLRYDFDGPLSEKNGDLFNFDPKLYAATDSAVTSTGFIIAGNNKQFGTPGVSDSTLKGRQWGLGPRLGIAWAPKFNNGKVVWRAGAGVYYDRGEYFQYLSPPAGQGISGPFGVTEEAPFAAYTTSTGSLSQPFPGNLTAPTTPATLPSIMPTVNSIRSACNAYNVYNHVTGTYDGFNCNDGDSCAGVFRLPDIERISCPIRPIGTSMFNGSLRQPCPSIWVTSATVANMKSFPYPLTARAVHSRQLSKHSPPAMASNTPMACKCSAPPTRPADSMARATPRRRHTPWLTNHTEKIAVATSTFAYPT